MRKRYFFIAAAIASTCLIAGNVVFGRAETAEAATKQYYIGGMTAGFMLSAGGAQVIGLSEVVAEDGAHRPAEDAGIKPGDFLCAANGINIKSIANLNSALELCGGKPVSFTVKRSGEFATVDITPVKETKSGKYKIGVLIRDTLSGIGTVTYIEKDTMRFGSLGHGITDENKVPLEIADSKVYTCSVIGVNKGTRGKAGELRGLFINDKPIAKADCVLNTGLYGSFDRGYDFSRCELVESAPMSEATIGKAFIYSTINGTQPQKYEIAIAKVDASNHDNKNFVVKVTDKRLIEETGGIVQGMSGSPIIQNGKLVGAITHVFINDPTRGYGIGIENMLQN